MYFSKPDLLRASW